jgi:DNA (cytosine-5)-methyltransferase 1
VSKLRVLDLFSGIGGFSLGLERTGGFETVAFCEIEPFPRRVLAKHWLGVPCYEDVRTLTAAGLAADGIAVDVICGGFPCQDISFAGNGAGLAGERSGLWSEIRRLAGDIRPELIILENVGALLSRGLDAVLGHLAALGYDAEWHCIPASALGAPHRRDRIWIVAYPEGDGWTGGASGHQDRNASAARAVGVRREPSGSRSAYGPWALADAIRVNEQGLIASFIDSQEWARQVERQAGSCGNAPGWWGVEPDVGRVADGVPDRAHRLKALGNAVVPQIPELIGHAILASRRAAA